MNIEKITDRNKEFKSHQIIFSRRKRKTPRRVWTALAYMSTNWVNGVCERRCKELWRGAVVRRCVPSTPARGCTTTELHPSCESVWNLTQSGIDEMKLTAFKKYSNKKPTKSDAWRGKKKKFFQETVIKLAFFLFSYSF